MRGVAAVGGGRFLTCAVRMTRRNTCDVTLEQGSLRACNTIQASTTRTIRTSSGLVPGLRWALSTPHSLLRCCQFISRERLAPLHIWLIVASLQDRYSEICNYRVRYESI